MANAAPFFKCYPSNFLSGVLGLGPDQIAVYTVVLMLIYDRGEPIEADMDILAWRCRMNVRRFKNVIDELALKGKLTLLPDGRLSNNRAEQEIIRQQETSQKQAANAHARWDLDKKKPNEYNGPEMPPHSDGNACQKLEAKEEEKNLKVLCPKPVRTKARIAYPQDFEGFWSGYPTDANMSKKDAGSAWAKLSDEDRALALASLPAYRAYCQSHSDYRPKHADGYLKSRRFEGHAKVAAMSTKKHFHRKSAPQFRAWDDYLRRTTGKGAPISDKHDGWSFDSEWPPGHTSDAERAA